MNPGYGLHERGTHAGWVRKGPSWYVRASMHPVATTAVAIGTALLINAYRSNHRDRARQRVSGVAAG
jgi:hypothetical protein